MPNGLGQSQKNELVGYFNKIVPEIFNETKAPNNPPDPTMSVYPLDGAAGVKIGHAETTVDEIKILSSKDNNFYLFQQPSSEKTSQGIEGLLYNNFNNLTRSDDILKPKNLVLVYSKDLHKIHSLFEIVFNLKDAPRKISVINEIYDFKGGTFWDDLQIDTKSRII